MTVTEVSEFPAMRRVAVILDAQPEIAILSFLTCVRVDEIRSTCPHLSSIGVQMNLKSISLFGLTIAFAGVFAPTANAQHLIFKPKTADKTYTCIYGEIEVLATNKTIYYCGCNWWPGNPAGGYTGIQDQGDGRHNMIFSIWDTSATLHPEITETETRTKGNRFGGEGTGAHTHLDYDWKLGGIYRYYATKEQDATGKNTLTMLYFYDEGFHKWVHEATISNPNDGHVSVKTFGGSLYAFLENWSGQERTKPKLAIYRLWVGSSPTDMENVTTARGDGNWGVLGDTFYLAEGDPSALQPIIDKARHGGSVDKGKADRTTLTVPERRIPPSVIRALKKLPKKEQSGPQSH